MKVLKVKALKHQIEFYKDTHTRWLALIAGYGAGKTHALIWKALSLSALNPNTIGVICSPTHAMNKRNIIPDFKATLVAHNLPFKMVMSPHPMVTIRWKTGTSTILFESAESYDRMAGLNLAWFIFDEMDKSPKHTAWAAWYMAVSRLRSIGTPHPQGCVTSTPEGYNFCYEFFERDVKNKPELAKKVRMIRASTYDNPFLADDYIESMRMMYPPQLIEAYLHGKFVNLNSKTVYLNFDRDLNGTDCDVEWFDKRDTENVALHIGMDFNIGKCSAIVHVIDGRNAYAVAEFQGIHNTEAMIKAIRARYGKGERVIYIYPDASGNNQSTNASKTDIMLLKDAGFFVKAHKANPRITDRVNCMNAMFLNGLGQRRYHINTMKCPVLTEALETQAYDVQGKPDKAHDQDHPCDAAGYAICFKFPIRAMQQKLKLVGV